MKPPYLAELDTLWARLAASAAGRPSVEALWSRDSDPRVTRIVQSAAYLFGRVREKLEDDIPELSHAIVASALPEALRPFPSATIVQIRDDRRARRALSELPASSPIESRPVNGAPCLFRTSWPAPLAPLSLTGRVHRRDAGSPTLALELSAYADVSLPLAVPKTLRVFVQTADPLAALDVVRGVCGSTAPLVVRALDAQGHTLSTREVHRSARWTALQPGFSLVPGIPQDRFASGSLLRALSGFPELFGFFDFEGLPEAVTGLDKRARSLEVCAKLEGSLRDVALDAQFYIGCVPAANVFDARSSPLPVRELGSAGVLVPGGPPGREFFHIEKLTLVTETDPDRPVPVLLWERSAGLPLSDRALHARIERREDGMHVELLRPNGGAGISRGKLIADGFATDGRRTEGLLPGDVAANLTRVSPPRPVLLDGRLPWRVNAYARVPLAQFTIASSLASYLELHDVIRAAARPRGTRPREVGVGRVVRQRATRVMGDEVRHGERIDLELDEETLGGPGATWLVGEVLARAVAERTDLLRFARTRLVAGGRVVADYGYRDGERLPPPFG